jgi:hypothetical protein
VSAKADWLIVSASTLLGAAAAFLAVYNLTVWLLGPAHHDQSDIGIGLAGILFGTIAALVGAVIGRALALRHVRGAATRRRASRQ